MEDSKKGFMRVPNDIAEAISATALSGGEYRVLLAIMRQTYGFNRAEKDISLLQIQKITGLAKGSASRALAMLKDKNIIVCRKQEGNRVRFLSINTDLSAWLKVRKVEPSKFKDSNLKGQNSEPSKFKDSNLKGQNSEPILYKDNFKDSFKDSVLKTGADAPSAHTTSTKKIFGYFENVLLTDNEYQKLAAEIPNVDEYINHFSEYLESSGKKYNSHFATIRLWYHDDVKKQKTQPKPNPAVDDDGESSFDTDEWYKQALGYDPEKISFK